MQREWGGWVIAVAISLLLHGLLLLHPSTLISATDGRAERQAGLTRVSFRTMPRPVPPPRDPPEPVPTPKPQLQPRLRPVTKPAPPSIERLSSQAAVPEPVASPAAPAPAAHQPRGDPRLADRARRNYLGLLVAHIERYKRYPRAARRRRLQGVVRVSFVLRGNGGIAALRVDQESAHPVLAQAAVQTVRSALPLPAAPEEVECPMRVSFGMAFTLR